jgi:hypothetical protein
MIKKILKLFLLSSLAVFLRVSYISFLQPRYEPKSGDLIFQAEYAPNGFAIQALSASRYNHVGIVMKRGGKFYVYEGIGKVTRTPLNNYTNRRYTHGKFRVMRLKEDEFNYSNVMNEISKLYGRKYDFALGWSDDRMYCSELVYKVILRGIKVHLSTPRSVEDRPYMNLLSRVVESNFKAPNINKKEVIVTPGDLANSSKLTTVYSNQILFL